MSVILTLIIFGIIVMIHEFGHYYAAKKCGVGVIEFAVGMGPKVCSFTKNGTRYSVRLLPLGGFCRMKGEDDSATDPDSFQNVSLIRRMIIVLAGPFMNFVLAFFVFAVLVMFMPLGTNYVSAVSEGTPAETVGIVPGDRIVKINNSGIHNYTDLGFFMSRYSGGGLKIKLKGEGGSRTVILTPEYDEEKGSYLMGIQTAVKTAFIGERIEGAEKAGFFECIANGFWYMIFMIKATVSGLLSLITAKVGLDQVSGPIGLTSEVGTVYREAKSMGLKVILLNMAEITGLLSANLGVMNLLPIPALDGGRFLFFVAEGIRRKRIPPEKEGMVHLAGFALLMLFGLVVAFKDIMKIF